MAEKAPPRTRSSRPPKAAHVDHFVRTLPDGYDTRIDDDATNCPQGEKQLLTIARAFLADPQILILDEATSSVDTRTEVLIQQAMARLMKGRTSFVIAHRLSTIRDADTILVMNHGSIVEQGTHEELIARQRLLLGPLQQPVRRGRSPKRCSRLATAQERAGQSARRACARGVPGAGACARRRRPGPIHSAAVTCAHAPVPFRRSAGVGAFRGAWAALARRAESIGYDVLVMPDDLGHQLSPLAALSAAAAATTRLRVGAFVFANDYRHPLILAREAATLDLSPAGGSRWASERAG